MEFYTYYRSSAAYRVRIALNLKGLEPTPHYVHLRKGEQRSGDYLALNPQGLVPSLVDGEARIGQSMAILAYLDECYPEPPLLPAGSAARARVRQLAYLIACDIHPLDNLKVLNYLSGELAIGEAARGEWYRHWVMEGLGAFEALLAGNPATGRFCHGEAPGLADICLVPQVYNAGRFDCDLSGFPNILRIDAACRELEIFTAAAPEAQPDAE